jgi:hypothetical protein
MRNQLLRVLANGTKHAELIDLPIAAAQGLILHTHSEVYDKLDKMATRDSSLKPTVEEVLADCPEFVLFVPAYQKHFH